MSRIPALTPGQLDPAQAALYREITGGPRAQGPQHFALTGDDGALHGPFNALLLSPTLGSALQELGAAIRYCTALSPRVRELAILVVANSWDSSFELHAHESVGRSVGLTESDFAALRSGGDLGLADPIEVAAVALCRALVAGDVDDAQWAAARSLLDDATIFELTTLVGYYATLALQLRTFRVDESEN
ncbi:carboxymuconolactone decarboxylase family protein [soil metagenome]